jgi:hypothetical protein
VDTRLTRHDDGTVDVVQTAPTTRFPPQEELEAIYWRELRGTTLGLARFSRDAIRVLGVWPALLRFGPARDGARPIVGGIFARKPHGVIRWAAGDGQIVVAVERFAPLLRGPLWGLESWLHDIVGRRYIARAARWGA